MGTYASVTGIFHIVMGGNLKILTLLLLSFNIIQSFLILPYNALSHTHSQGPLLLLGAHNAKLGRTLVLLGLYPTLPVSHVLRIWYLLLAPPVVTVASGVRTPSRVVKLLSAKTVTLGHSQATEQQYVLLVSLVATPRLNLQFV
jgi:hypothetical protein